MNNAVAIGMYLLMGFLLYKDGSKGPSPRHDKYNAVYVVMWLPIEVGTWCSNAVANLYLSSARMQGEFENAVLQALFDEGATSAEDLKSNVVTAMCGEELGWLTYWYLLRHLVLTGWVHKQTHRSVDRYRENRTETWYSLTESGIREMKERGLH